MLDLIKTKISEIKFLKFKLILLAVFIIIFTGSDLIVKEIATATLKGNPDVRVIENFWYFSYHTNDDIGFSLLQGLDDKMSEHGKWIFLVILQSAGTILVFLFFLYTNDKFQLFALALIVSGALGNVIDRIIRGAVVDYVMWWFRFIPMRLFNPWPIFNLADVYTVTGAILFLLAVFIFERNHKDNKPISTD